MACWTYILRCADGSYYVGCTTALEQRIGRHQAGTYGGYTSTRLPVEVAWCAEFQSIYEAIAFERTLKRWSRAKKEAFIAGDWKRLMALSSRSRAEVVVLARRPPHERYSG